MTFCRLRRLLASFVGGIKVIKIQLTISNYLYYRKDREVPTIKLEFFIVIN